MGLIYSTKDTWEIESQERCLQQPILCFNCILLFGNFSKYHEKDLHLLRPLTISQPSPSLYTQPVSIYLCFTYLAPSVYKSFSLPLW